MGLFDKMNTDGTGSTGLFVQEAIAFAKLDLNGIFKMAGAAVASIITNAIKTFDQFFGHKDCNYQDSTLVERFQEQIPGMLLLLIDLGYYDESNREWVEKDILHEISEWSRPRGTHPCNELLYPARLLMTILFGVRITNDQYLDALDSSVESYYAAGPNTWDIPREAVERAVMLKQKYFPISTYNTQQWDLNKFQDYPLVAPIPDPMQPGVLYSGDFLGLHIVDGKALGSTVPDIPAIIKQVEAKDSGTPVVPGSPGTTPNTNVNADPIQKLISYAKANPVQAVGAAAVLAFVIFELETDDN